VVTACFGSGKLFPGMYEWEALLKMSGQAWVEIRETLIDAFYAFFFIFTFLAFREY